MNPKAVKKADQRRRASSAKIATVHVTVAKGLSMKDGREAVIAKALRTPGKTDVRGATYDPATGKGSAT